jgi:hypothetical protein
VQVAGQLSQLDPLTAGGVEPLDQCLLTLDPPQCQVPVA